MEWVSAREAIEALGAMGDRADCPQGETIRSAAERGQVESRATRFRRLQSHPPAVQDSSHAFYSTPSDGSLPDQFWQLMGNAGSVADWDTGRFSCFPPGIHEEWRADGVEFVREDMIDIGGTFLDASEPNDQTTEPKAAVEAASGNRGAPRSDKWSEFVAELCLWAFDVHDPTRMNSRRLLKEINDRLADRDIDEMPRSTVHDTLMAVLRRLKSRFEA